MDKNKMIILALIVVIAALLVGMAFTMMPNMAKQDTNLKFKSNSTLTEGDSLNVKLTDGNGSAIANQTVNITITDKDKSNSYYSVLTNENGTGKLKLDKSPGEYNVTLSYGGNDNYKDCNATQKITITEKVIETQSSSESSSQPSSESSSQSSESNEEEVFTSGPLMGQPKSDAWKYELEMQELEAEYQAGRQAAFEEMGYSD